MKFKTPVVLTAAILMASPAHSYAQTTDTSVPAPTKTVDNIPADRLIEAQAIVAASYPEDEREELFLSAFGNSGDQIAASLSDNPAFQDDGARAIAEKFVKQMPGRLAPAMLKHLPNMLEAQAIAYANQFSLEELKEIRTFAETQTGSRFFKFQPQMVSDPAMIEAMLAMVGDTREIQKQMIEELTVELMEYNFSKTK